MSKIIPTITKAAEWFLVSKRVTAILTILTAFGVVAPDKATAIRDVVIGLFG